MSLAYWRADGQRRQTLQAVLDVERVLADVLRKLIAWTAQPPEPKVRPYVLGIELRVSGTLIGHVGLSAARGSVEIGYAVEDAHQGQGLAGEAVAAVAAWGLSALALPEVLGIVERDNTPSRRVLERAGFALVSEDGVRIVYRALP